VRGGGATALGRPQVGKHIRAALANGATKDEIGQLLTLLAFYGGCRPPGQRSDSTGNLWRVTGMSEVRTRAGCSAPRRQQVINRSPGWLVPFIRIMRVLGVWPRCNKEALVRGGGDRTRLGHRCPAGAGGAAVAIVDTVPIPTAWPALLRN